MGRFLPCGVVHATARFLLCQLLMQAVLFLDHARGLFVVHVTGAGLHDALALLRPEASRRRPFGLRVRGVARPVVVRAQLGTGMLLARQALGTGGRGVVLVQGVEKGGGLLGVDGILLARRMLLFGGGGGGGGGVHELQVLGGVRRVGWRRSGRVQGGWRGILGAVLGGAQGGQGLDDGEAAQGRGAGQEGGSREAVGGAAEHL